MDHMIANQIEASLVAYNHPENPGLNRGCRTLIYGHNSAIRAAWLDRLVNGTHPMFDGPRPRPRGRGRAANNA